MTKHLRYGTTIALDNYAELFAKDADKNLEAAKILNNEGVGVIRPALHLANRSLELELKSRLMRVGMPLNKLRNKPYGHDLSALYEKCIEKRALTEGVLTAWQHELLQALGCEYTHKVLEYPDIPHAQVAPQDWIDIAASIINALLVHGSGSIMKNA